MRKRAGVTTDPWRNQGVAKTPARLGKAKAKRPFTDAEIVALLAAPADDEMASAMRMAALTGMRLEEIYRLTVADCADGWLRIRVAKTDAGSDRRVPIHPDLAGC